MSVSIEVPKEYGYVLLTAVASGLINSWHSSLTGKFRKAAGVPYPNAYASDHTVSLAEASDPAKAKALHLFNCAQRAHANYLEQQPSFLAALLVAGAKFPVAAAGLGAVWCVSRIMYAVGYTRADKEKGRGRLMGLGYAPAQIALMGMAGWVGWKLLSGQ